MITLKDFEKAIADSIQEVKTGSGIASLINENKAAAACYELAKQMQPTWIPVSERKPDPIKSVIIYFDEVIAIGYLYENQWYIEARKVRGNVTHWQPLHRHRLPQ